MNRQRKEQLDRMFQPRGAAFFGGVASPGSFGHLIIMSNLRYGYPGRIYPVSAKGGEIAGLRVLSSLDEADGPIDLASIALPAAAVPEVVEECLARGIPGVQIQSSGFAELGTDEGRRLQARLAEIAARGISIVGPNCFGLHCPRGGITLLPGSDFSRTPGSTAMIAQSGGVTTDFGHEARYAGLGVSKAVSYGNACDVDAAVLLEYLAGDDETACISLYLEGVRDARRFLEALRRAAAIKPVVVWKAGLTDLGGRAVTSHTGSLSGEAGMWRAALRQAGAIPVQGLGETIDALTALRYLRTPARRIALVGGGGAIGVYGSDLAADFGLDLPEFSAETQTRLARRFKSPGNSVRNPLDTGTPLLAPEIMKELLFDVMTREPVDVVVIMLLLRPLEVEIRVFSEMMGVQPPERGAYMGAMLEILAELRRETGRDVVAVFDNRGYRLEDIDTCLVDREMRPRFQERGIGVFSSVERALSGIALARRSPVFRS